MHIGKHERRNFSEEANSVQDIQVFTNIHHFL